MSEFRDTIESTYDKIWKDIQVSGECLISMIPLTVHMTKYGKFN